MPYALIKTPADGTNDKAPREY